jgi:hypothetical protein
MASGGACFLWVNLVHHLLCNISIPSRGLYWFSLTYVLWSYNPSECLSQSTTRVHLLMILSLAASIPSSRQILFQSGLTRGSLCVFRWNENCTGCRVARAYGDDERRGEGEASIGHWRYCTSIHSILWISLAILLRHIAKLLGIAFTFKVLKMRV